ncbi:hypothetical protein [Shimia sagamensis]|uniref:Uncharacterized protein n=1 Tax=Shimia sagamensis TaxID=1566352 RepID=A0ABY1P1F5_9RHOB|nr:hypothetical protein [Shimia sagamensis]SMP22587.1 hypothetical protein SAMN06265373_104216 [Shimia sagamensis]
MTKSRSLPSNDDQSQTANDTLVGTIRISGDWARKVRGDADKSAPAPQAANDDYAEHALFASRKSS